MKRLLLILALLGLLFVNASAVTVVVGQGTVAAGGGYATPAIIQSNAGYNTTVATLGSNGTVGNYLVIWVSANATPSSCVPDTGTSDGGGVASWTSGTIYNNSTSVYGRWYWGKITEACAIAVDLLNAPSDRGWTIYEVSNIAATSPTAYQAGATVSGTSFSSGNVVTSTPCMLFGAWADEDTNMDATWAVQDPVWGDTTYRSDHYHGTAARSDETGTYAASGTNTSTSTGIAVILALEAAEN